MKDKGQFTYLPREISKLSLIFPALYVEAEAHDIAFPDDVVLALES